MRVLPCKCARMAADDLKDPSRNMQMMCDALHRPCSVSPLFFSPGHGLSPVDCGQVQVGALGCGTCCTDSPVLVAALTTVTIPLWLCPLPLQEIGVQVEEPFGILALEVGGTGHDAADWQHHIRYSWLSL